MYFLGGLAIWSFVCPPPLPRHVYCEYPPDPPGLLGHLAHMQTLLLPNWKHQFSTKILDIWSLMPWIVSYTSENLTTAGKIIAEIWYVQLILKCFPPLIINHPKKKHLTLQCLHTCIDVKREVPRGLTVRKLNSGPGDLGSCPGYSIIMLWSWKRYLITWNFRDT